MIFSVFQFLYARVADLNNLISIRKELIVNSYPDPKKVSQYKKKIVIFVFSLEHTAANANLKNKNLIIFYIKYIFIYNIIFGSPRLI